MITPWHVFEALKAQAWEEAKGKLRGLVAVAGSSSDGADAEGAYPFQKLEKAVEDFIRNVEDNGLTD